MHLILMLSGGISTMTNTNTKQTYISPEFILVELKDTDIITESVCPAYDCPIESEMG